LAKYDEIGETDYLDYISEWEKEGKTIIPGSSDRKGRSFGEMVEKWRQNEKDERYAWGKVPSTLYFLVENDGRILGAIDFRHSLNEILIVHGGHIGYGVRPSERRKGYCSLMLKTLLDMIRLRGYSKVLLTCDDDNIGSIRTIEKNGGVLEDKVIYEGKLSRRYWIDLKVSQGIQTWRRIMNDIDDTELIRSVEAGEWQPVAALDELKKILIAAASETALKDHRINVRISNINT
jgi:predicted acetyltransferase